MIYPNLKRLALAVTVMAIASLAMAQQDYAQIAKKMGLEQKLGGQVPLDVPFTDSDGKQIKLGDVVGDRPVLILPIFYTCTGICAMELGSLMKTIVKLKGSYPVGESFDIVAFSIRPKETHELAKAKLNEALDLYNNGTSSQGWHFLTGPESSAKKVADALGFKYVYDAPTDRTNHPAAIMMLTADGRISKYFFGTEYPTVILTRAIDEAQAGKVGQKAQLILLGCVQVDPITGQRTLVVRNVLKVAGILTVLILVTSIVAMSIKTRRQEVERDAALQGGQAPPQ